MFAQFAGLTVLFFLFNLAVIVFLIWLVYRFVTAHESIADSLKKIERKMADSDAEDRF